MRLPYGSASLVFAGGMLVVVPREKDQEMGIIGMKIPSRGRLLAGFTPPPEGSPTRRPQDKGPGTLRMQEAMRYVLSLPVSTVIVGCDSVGQVEENVRIAREFNPLSGAQMATLEEKAKPVYEQALFFRRWT